jgi:hypothetical protein
VQVVQRRMSLLRVLSLCGGCRRCRRGPSRAINRALLVCCTAWRPGDAGGRFSGAADFLQTISTRRWRWVCRACRRSCRHAGLHGAWMVGQPSCPADMWQQQEGLECWCPGKVLCSCIPFQL